MDTRSPAPNGPPSRIRADLFPGALDLARFLPLSPLGTLDAMTGAPYGGWGTGQDRPARTGMSGVPPMGPPTGSVPRDPYAPFGPQQPITPQVPPPGSRPIGPARPASLSIDAYKPPKRRVGPLLAFLVGFAVLIGGFMSAGYLARTAQTTPSATPSPTATLPGLAFETDSATGAWEITNTQWSSDHVVLDVTLTVRTGSFRYSFYAYNNAAMRLAYPDSGSSSRLRSGTLGSGQSVSGTLSFQLAHGEGTLVMLDAMENQVSGLPIKP